MAVPCLLLAAVGVFQSRHSERFQEKRFQAVLVHCRVQGVQSKSFVLIVVRSVSGLTGAPMCWVEHTLSIMIFTKIHAPGTAVTTIYYREDIIKPKLEDLLLDHYLSDLSLINGIPSNSTSFFGKYNTSATIIPRPGLCWSLCTKEISPVHLRMVSYSAIHEQIYRIGWHVHEQRQYSIRV